MAHMEVWRDWKPHKWLPFIETRTVAWCLDSMPGMPVDSSTVSTQFRLRRTKPEQRQT